MIEQDQDIDLVRRLEFDQLEDAAYLNAASLGPLPKRTRGVLADYAERRSRVHAMSEADFSGPPAAAREAAARLIGASPDEIALGPNTSFGINLAATGLQVPHGSTVVISEGEFPANVYPWMNRDHLRVELVPRAPEGWPDEERMLDRVAAGGVSILAISSVQFDNGYRADLPRIGQVCRANDCFLVVDAIQSLGHLPLDVEACGVDVLAAGGHKWLCGPFGSGFAYVRREVQERLEPKVVGWYSMEAGRDLDSVTDYEWAFVDDASRYEVGTLANQDVLGFATSVSLLFGVGIDTIWSRVEAVLDPMRRWLLDHPEASPLGSFESTRKSGIIAFRPPAVAEVYRELKRAGVICSVREGAIRIAAHLYNTDEHVGRVLQVLESRAARGW
jgi:cysteine desulfurase / selenocysteine lyase